MNRYRFAPSPTGPLHMGNVRTALFNWLAARHDGGSFILRIDDTDRERSAVEFEEAVLDDLHWLGLDWDEGALPGGAEQGAHGPYRQSQRLAIYARYADQLVERGCAYPCFCSDLELERRRSLALAAGRPPHYDGTCLRLTPEERASRIAAGEPHTLHFAMPDRAVRVQDLVRGEVTFGLGMVGDFVLLRSDRYPTYNFACVIDDALMHITHVIRGEDHLANTLRQVVLYEALGWEPPRFVHAPLILGPDRAKLSKRHGDVQLADYRGRGHLPRTLLNHLALLGWSSPDGREVLTPGELIERFDPQRISRAAAVFDPGKLAWIGIQHMRAAPLAEVVEVVRPWVTAAGVTWSGARLERGVELLRDGMSCGADFTRELAIFRPGCPQIEPSAREWISEDAARVMLSRMADVLEKTDQWDAATIQDAVRTFGRACELKGKALFMPVRVAVTGRSAGPGLAETLELLGRDEVTARLRRISTEGA